MGVSARINASTALPLGNTPLFIQQEGAWSPTRAGLGALERRYVSCVSEESNHESSVAQLRVITIYSMAQFRTFIQLSSAAHSS
jgi:hypothetical protein